MNEILQLYKSIRRLHRKLPPDLEFIGNRYIKQEFRLHRNCQPEFVPGFIQAWQVYKKTLEVQLNTQSENPGLSLRKEEVESFSAQQLGK